MHSTGHRKQSQHLRFSALEITFCLDNIMDRLMPSTADKLFTHFLQINGRLLASKKKMSPRFNQLSTLKPRPFPPPFCQSIIVPKQQTVKKTFSISKIGQKRRNNSEWQMGCSTPCQKWKVNELQKGKLLNYRLGGQQFQFKFSIYAFFTANHAWRSDGWEMWGN